MASSYIDLLYFAGKEMTIYFGIPIGILSVIGGCLNVIIFLSLKTFRQSSCAFYLMIMSAYDVGRTLSNALPFIMRWGFGINWSTSSLLFCKIRVTMLHTCTLCSLTCLCLATIDQYFATSSRPHWRKWCNIRLAHGLTSIFIIIWILHGIPYLIFFNRFLSPSTNTIVCVVTNNIFNQYLTYGYYLILSNLLLLLTTVFGLMAYYNARHLSHRRVPLVRRELDKQLTVMVLVQVFITFCTVLPSYVNNMFLTIKPTLSDPPVVQAQRDLAGIVFSNILVLGFASPFYTYVCASQRFRRQLRHVLFDMHIKRCRPNKIAPNEKDLNEIELDVTMNI